MTAGADVRIWDAKTGDEILRQRVNGTAALDVSPDGKQIAVGYYPIHVWDWESGAEPRKLNVPLRTGIDDLHYSPDGRKLYVAEFTGLRAVDPATGKPRGKLAARPGARRICSSPDGRRYAVEYFRLSGRSEHFVTIHQSDTGAEIAALPCGADPAHGGSWSRNGSRYAAPNSYRVWVWDVPSGKALGQRSESHDAIVLDMAFSSDGRLFTASDDRTIRAWDPSTGRQVMKLEMTGWVRSLAVSRDGSLVAGNGLNQDLRVWDARTGKQIYKLLGHGQAGYPGRVWFDSDDERMATYGDDFYLRVWDTMTGKLKIERRFVPAEFAASVDDEDGRAMMFYLDREASMTPDGRTFLLVAGKNVKAIDVETGKEKHILEADPSQIQKLAIAPDGKRFATAGPGVVPPAPKAGQRWEQPKAFQVSIWQLGEAKAVIQFQVPGPMFNGRMAFTPDGTRLALATSGDSLSFWDIASGTLVGTMKLPGRPACFAFDGAGKRIAVAMYDTTVLVYDLAAAFKPARKEQR